MIIDCTQTFYNDLQILKLYSSILTNNLLNVDIGFINLKGSRWANFKDILFKAISATVVQHQDALSVFITRGSNHGRI